MRVSRQLTFDFFVNSHYDFDSYFAVNQNIEVVTTLKSWAAREGTGIVYLWGDSSVGKTHLLQASLNSLVGRSIYIPIKEMADKIEPSSFEGLENVGVLALDDVEFLAGKKPYEEALFKLFNSVLSKKARLLLSGRKHPSRQGFIIEDLVSRLGSHLVYQVRQLSDSEKVEALTLLAQRRGINVEKHVWDFILSRSKRDMSSLVYLLEQLDEFSLTRMRRVTIPIVKEFFRTNSAIFPKD